MDDDLYQCNECIYVYMSVFRWRIDSSCHCDAEQNCEDDDKLVQFFRVYFAAQFKVIFVTIVYSKGIH